MSPTLDLVYYNIILLPALTQTALTLSAFFCVTDLRLLLPLYQPVYEYYAIEAMPGRTQWLRRQDKGHLNKSRAWTTVK